MAREQAGTTCHDNLPYPPRYLNRMLLCQIFVFTARYQPLVYQLRSMVGDMYALVPQIFGILSHLTKGRSRSFEAKITVLPRHRRYPPWYLYSCLGIEKPWVELGVLWVFRHYSFLTTTKLPLIPHVP